MLARIFRARPVLAAPKYYTTSAKEGSVAQSKGFNKKEQAHENEYARRQEASQLQKLRKQIEAKKAELAELEKAHNEATTKTE